MIQPYCTGNRKFYPQRNSSHFTLTIIIITITSTNTTTPTTIPLLASYCP
jgi:hypothetical protein